jgi:hypothetical protein
VGLFLTRKFAIRRGGRPEFKKLKLVPFIRHRRIITAAHCLPHLPAPHAWEDYDQVYPNLLVVLGEKPSVCGRLLFADPIADIAVLGSPDEQEMYEQAAAYDELVEAFKPQPMPKRNLRRIQPISARTGYARLAKPANLEKDRQVFDEQTLERLSHIMGRNYSSAKLAITFLDDSRQIPVLQREDSTFSGFHGGAGETAMAELLQQTTLKYSILLIDEIETSLHPRVQCRLIRDLASLCRELDAQIVLTTHSPYVLSELPAEARIYIMDGSAGKQIIKGVSPDFAMTKMDEEPHPEAELYTEDGRSADLLREIIISQDREVILRLRFIPFGAASVGRALGEMHSRFPRPSIIFLDGDQEPSAGCLILPGGMLQNV